MTFCNHALDHTGLAGDLASPIHRLDPRAKVLGLLAVTLVAVTTPVALWPVFGACALALAVVAALARVPARTLWQRGRIVLLPLPGGVGGTEGGMTGAFVACGVSLELSLVSVVTYQVISSYLPAIPGLPAYAALRRRMRSWGEPEPEPEPA